MGDGTRETAAVSLRPVARPRVPGGDAPVFLPFAGGGRTCSAPRLDPHRGHPGPMRRNTEEAP